MVIIETVCGDISQYFSLNMTAWRTLDRLDRIALQIMKDHKKLNLK